MSVFSAFHRWLPYAVRRDNKSLIKIERASDPNLAFGPNRSKEFQNVKKLDLGVYLYFIEKNTKPILPLYM